MNYHKAVKLATNASSLASHLGYPRQVFDGLEAHRKEYKVNDVNRLSNLNGRTGRDYHARLLWVRLKEGRLPESAAIAVRRDYAKEFEQFAKEEESK